jgi:predicted oxidoreductase
MCSLNPGQDEVQVQMQLSYRPFGFLFVILALSDDMICVVAPCIVVSVKHDKMWHVVEGVCNGLNVWIKRVR